MKVNLNIVIDIGDDGNFCGNCHFLEYPDRMHGRGAYCRLFDKDFDELHRLEVCKRMENIKKQEERGE